MQIPTTGMHHITLIGSNREDTINFYQGVLGMPLVFKQPNLDVPEEAHLCFDPGDGILITFFVRTDRETDPEPVPEVTGNVHHIAYAVSRETYNRAAKDWRNSATRTPQRSTAGSWTRSTSGSRTGT